MHDLYESADAARGRKPTNGTADRLHGLRGALPQPQRACGAHARVAARKERDCCLCVEAHLARGLLGCCAPRETLPGLDGVHQWHGKV